MSVSRIQQQNIRTGRGLVLPILLVILLFSAVRAMGLELPATTFARSGPVRLLPGGTLAMRVRVLDPDGLAAVRCYFRYRSGDPFLFVDMRPDGEGWYQGILPAPADSVPAVEYLFLAVNSRGQVVRTDVAVLDPAALEEMSGQPLIDSPVTAARTDLPAVPSVDGWFQRPAEVRVQPVDDRDRSGLAAGLYERADLAGRKTVAGYYGGFLYRDDGTHLPLKGLMLLPGGELTLDSYAAQGTTEEIVGPPIAGYFWSGQCYLLGGTTGNHFFEREITAVVTQEGNAVTITTSDPCVFNYGMDIIGPYFEGIIDAAGNMALVDECIPPQTWTTHWGPATATSIMIGDYSNLPSEEDWYGDYFVIELSRVAPADPRTFLPILNHLLLHRPTP